MVYFLHATCIVDMMFFLFRCITVRKKTGGMGAFVVEETKERTQPRETSFIYKFTDSEF